MTNDELICQYLIAMDEGRAPSQTQWLHDHPDVAEELKQFLDDLDSVQHLLDNTDDNNGNHRGNHGDNHGDNARDNNGGTGNQAADSTRQDRSASNSESGKTPEQSPDVPARTLGRFELLECIGRGASGSVWKAVDSTIGRQVAIKVPHVGGLATDDRERLLREARAAGRLRHPHIVRLHEVGETDDVIYLVSDLVEGATLSEWLTQRSVTTREATKLCVKLARAIQHAHEAGVIHRDLKPANILVDRDEQPLITDFGLAKFVEHGHQSMTVAGQVIGTPAYMAPEQASGDSHRADARSDVYALGGLYFFLLTGEKPFRGDAQQLIKQTLVDDPPNPASLNGNVTKDQATVCLKCLEKDPARRYATAHLLCDDLRRLLDDEPIKARPVGRFERAFRWCRRQPYVAATVVLLALLLLTVGVAGSLLAVHESQRENQLIEAQIESLLAAQIEAVPAMVEGLQVAGRQAQMKLNRVLKQGSLSASEDLRVRLALLPTDPAQATVLQERLLESELSECLIVCDALRPYQTALSGPYWQVLRDKSASHTDQQRLTAAIALAMLDVSRAKPDAEKWQHAADDVARLLIAACIRNPTQLRPIADALRPVRKVLRLRLSAIFRNHDSSAGQDSSFVAALLLASFFDDQPEHLVELLAVADQRQFFAIMEPLSKRPDASVKLLEEHLQRRSGGAIDSTTGTLSPMSLANLAIASGRLGQTHVIWRLLQQREDPTARSYLIQRMISWGIDPRVLIERAGQETNARALQGVVLSLGNWTEPPPARSATIEQLLAFYQSHPDAGVHSAASWLLRRWGCSSRLDEVQHKLTSQEPQGSRRWYRLKDGTTMSVIRGPVKFLMGDPESSKLAHDQQHAHSIPRHFAISTTEVTVEQFQRFLQAEPQIADAFESAEDARQHPRLSQTGVTWYEASAYCRWLSEQQEIPLEQMCRPAIGHSKGPWKFRSVSIGRYGYRLPTEAEWEFACRAGATGPYHFGNLSSEADLFTPNGNASAAQIQAVGLFRPNGLGLFDCHENAVEWCRTRYQPYASATPGAPATEWWKNYHQHRHAPRVLRGGNMLRSDVRCTSSQRDSLEPTRRADAVGFRIARTLPLSVFESESQSVSFVSKLGRVRCLAVSPDSQWFSSGEATGQIKYWSIATGTMVRQINELINGVRNVKFGPNANYCLTVSRRKGAALWSFPKGKPIRTFQGRTNQVTAATLSPNSDQILTINSQGRVLLWDVEEEKPLQDFKHDTAATTVSFLPSGEQFVTGGADGVLRLWKQNTDQPLQVMRGHTGPVHAMAISPNGRLALSCSDDPVVCLWDLSSGRRLHTLQGHDGPVTAVVFSHDSKTGFSASSDGTIRQWDLETGIEQGISTNHSSFVRALAITPDGQFLLSAAEDQAILRWRLSANGRCKALEAGMNGSSRRSSDTEAR